MEDIEVIIEENITDVEVVVNTYPANIEVIVEHGGGGDDLNKLVHNETPSGIINGTNALFNSLSPFVPESLQVYVNGLLIKPIDEWVNIGNNQIRLQFSPGNGESILINYIKL